jgi:cardiolipin synthase (CMP-forming)
MVLQQNDTVGILLIMMLKYISGLFSHLPPKERRFTFATKITLLRLVCIPFIAYYLSIAAWYKAFLLIVCAGLTDALDGFIARIRNETTVLGALLDPLFDKLLIISCYIILAFVNPSILPVPSWLVWLVLIKEVLLVGGTLILYGTGRFVVIKPTLLGKAAMAFQVFFIGWLIACNLFHWLPVKTYYAILVSIVFLVFASFYQYARVSMSSLKALNIFFCLCTIVFVSFLSIAKQDGVVELKENIVINKKNQKTVSASRLKEHIIDEIAHVVRERISYSRVLNDLDECALDVLDDALVQEAIFAKNDRIVLAKILEDLKNVHAHLEKNRIFLAQKLDALKKELSA